MLKNLVTKTQVEWNRSFSALGSVLIPAGAPVHKYRGEWWIDPTLFQNDKILQHDAIHYGCRIAEDNIVEEN